MEDMWANSRMKRLMFNLTGTCTGGRCVGWNSTNAMWATTWEIDRERGTNYHENLKNWLVDAQKRDISVCGALTGGIFVLSSTVKDPANREELYDRVYYLISQFKKQNDGKLDCLQLVGKEPGQREFVTVCPVLVETVVRLVEKIIPK